MNDAGGGASAAADVLARAKEVNFSRSEWFLIFTLILLLLVDTMATWICTSFMPDYLIDHGLSDTWAGLFMGLQMLMMLFATISAPTIIRHTSQLSCVLVGASFTFVATLLTGIVPPLLQGMPVGVTVIGLRAVMGFAEGVMQVATMAIGIRLVPESQMPLFTGLSEGTRALGGALGPLLGGSLYEVGGWSLPFYFIAGLQALCVLLLSALAFRVRDASSAVSNEAVSAFDLLARPPVWAVVVVTGAITLPLAMTSPLFEPYLSAPPFNMNPGGIGLLFGLLTICDIVGAVVTGTLQYVIGQLPLIHGSLVLLVLSCILIGVGPQTFPVFIVGCTFMSVVLPVLITATSLLLRLCRTYGLDAKAYSEVIAALLMSSVTLSMGLGSSFGGLLGATIGCRAAYASLAVVLLCVPPVFAAGMHPICLGRPLAPMADEDTDAQQTTLKAHNLAKADESPIKEI